MTRPLLWGVFVIVLTVSVVPGTADAVAFGPGTPQDGTASNGSAKVATTGAPETGVEMTRTYHLTPEEPGEVDVTLSFDPRSDAGALVVLANDRSEIRTANGFEASGDGRYRWDESTSSPSIRLSIPANETNGRFGGTDFVDAGEWALVSPYTGAAYWSKSADEWRFAGQGDGYDITNRVAGEGYAGVRYAYLGQHERYTRTVDGTGFTVVEPAVAAETADGRAILAAVSTPARSLDVDGETTAVNLFVAPEPIRGGGLTHPGTTDGEQDVWVAAGSSPTRVPIHEYVHTRQSFDATEETRWLHEASAKFYEWKFSVRRGDVDYAKFERAMGDSKFADAVLADGATWGSSGVDYRKGSRVVAALDARIRAETGGNRSFDDVLRRLNAHDGPVTLADFERIVGDVAGTSLDGWIDRYVTTAASPPYADDLAPAYYVADGGDEDGDGLANGRERTLGTDPLRAHSDGDGVPDGCETALETDPLATGSDGDGLPDDAELSAGTDPTLVDTDGDGLDDDRERSLGTDPTAGDSDGDGLSDAREAELGTGPTATTSSLDYWLAVARQLR